MIHKPVLEKEVIECLDPKPNENFIDCTLGHGGHARLILERTSPNGKLVGIDKDPEQIKIAKEQLKEF
ncbi:16S rRNA (cytosine(1402)-N(4))-methyltransferase, partial [Patescibacteria group bacterium]|nr:16S rRNA (cytosine(1402)-N(4))-methyltransferase [Patescibacteria group bacterium]